MVPFAFGQESEIPGHGVQHAVSGGPMQVLFKEITLETVRCHPPSVKDWRRLTQHCDASWRAASDFEPTSGSASSTRQWGPFPVAVLKVPCFISKIPCSSAQGIDQDSSQNHRHRAAKRLDSRPNRQDFPVFSRGTGKSAQQRQVRRRLPPPPAIPFFAKLLGNATPFCQTWHKVPPPIGLQTDCKRDFAELFS
jgi:hypothetical protein